MPDFTRPEYASYVEFCRSLRLERTFQRWDVVCQEINLEQDDARIRIGVGAEHYDHTDTELVWLPQLSDWLDMLEAVGALGVVIERLGSVYYATDRTPVTHAEGYARSAPTREEAAARLAIAMGAVSPVPT